MQIEMGTLAEAEYMQQAQAAVKREEVMETSTAWWLPLLTVNRIRAAGRVTAKRWWKQLTVTVVRAAGGSGKAQSERARGAAQGAIVSASGVEKQTDWHRVGRRRCLASRPWKRNSRADERGSLGLMKEELSGWWKRKPWAGERGSLGLTARLQADDVAVDLLKRHSVKYSFLVKPSLLVAADLLKRHSGVAR